MVDKKRRVATALKYKSDDSAPKLVAKGLGLVAENIINKATESEVAIYKDETLAKQLYNLSVGEQIPPDLYNAVAEVLVFIARLDKESKKNNFL